jgi:hypothetical protein
VSAIVDLTWGADGGAVQESVVASGLGPCAGAAARQVTGIATRPEPAGEEDASSSGFGASNDPRFDGKVCSGTGLAIGDASWCGGAGSAASIL